MPQKGLVHRQTHAQQRGPQPHAALPCSAGQQAVGIRTAAAGCAVAGLLGRGGQIKALLFRQIVNGIVQQALCPQAVPPPGKASCPFQQKFRPIQIVTA